MMNKRILYSYDSILICMMLLSVFFVQKGFTQSIPAEKQKAIYDLMVRVLPKGQEKNFEISFIDADNGKDVFEVEQNKSKILLKGNNGVSIASALNYYLKTYAHCDVSWNGSNLNLPNPLPVVEKKIRKVTPYKYRYYLNYCTFNYTMSWWDWKRWQQEIDWMALHGINMPLALTGQNIIWYRVYKSLGFTNKDLETFFSGPAYFNWFWMGNLDGWGGPLPQTWMQSHEALQKQILADERSLGMTPVLPAFTGHVPPAFTQRYPSSKVKRTNWSTFPEVNILDPSDSLFTVIGRKFTQELTTTYGTDHLYSADTFNENTPPSNDSVYLNDVSKKVYQSMAFVDPKAIWVMQGWLFYYSADFWKPTQIQALLNAVPNDKMIILDLWSEKNPVWGRTEAYYGKPWIWCMLHNFGGVNSLYGRMDRVANDPAKTLQRTDAGKISGIGLTMEAIEQNPVIYKLMLENVWEDHPIEVGGWLKQYAYARYGKMNKDAESAWEILRRTAYHDSITSGGVRSIFQARPTFAKIGARIPTKLPYQPVQLIEAWDKLVKASNDLANSEGYQYDLVDVTRQVLGNYSSEIQQTFAAAYSKGDIASFNTYKNKFLALMEDMDNLLATRKDFLLGKWLEDAKRWGTNAAEKQLYERNARDLITLWGDPNSTLHEYACKQWSGLIKGFYIPRWKQFFEQTSAAMASGKTFDQKKFETEMAGWEWRWVNGNERYADKPSGDAIAIALKIHEKYRKEMDVAYSANRDL
jgi:alpha-N-acetylglucosaminidase